MFYSVYKTFGKYHLPSLQFYSKKNELVGLFLKYIALERSNFVLFICHHMSHQEFYADSISVATVSQNNNGSERKSNKNINKCCLSIFISIIKILQYNIKQKHFSIFLGEVNHNVMLFCANDFHIKLLSVDSATYCLCSSEWLGTRLLPIAKI